MANEGSDDFVAPHPGSQAMPRWDTAELIPAPTFTLRNWIGLIGPGLVMGASAIGGGEWLVGPSVTARYGGALMWLATISILCQGLYNVEISRYTLYTGEPIFTGKFRTLPGPMFWIAVYLVLDFGAVFPYLAASAATPVAVVLKSGVLPNPDKVASDWWLMKITATAVFGLSLLPLVFGGKIYNSLKIVMSFKLVVVLGFLLFLAVFYSHASTWREIFGGFFKFGTVPIQRDEDLNGNGRLDPDEDWDSDGNLDVVEPTLPKTVDTNADGKPDTWAKDGAGSPIKFEDVDGDGYQDGANTDNVFVSLFTKGKLPPLDLQLIAMIAALAAIAGNGGLSNTPISNFTREQGWGMGHHVGAIPSIVGGHGISLSHVGCVFQVTDKTLPRWKKWYRHVFRDQWAVWVPACFIGVALPSMLSVEFLRRGTDAGSWNGAALTARGVGDAVANPPTDALCTTSGLSGFISGSAWGNFFWALTLFCGFLVLAPSMASTIDGVIRRWVDAFWTASARLRKREPEFIRHLYFRVLMIYACFGLVMLWAYEPKPLIEISTLLYNYALGFSCWHTLAVNTFLLPRELRPNWFVRLGLILGGVFFLLLAAVATYQKLIDFNLINAS